MFVVSTNPESMKANEGTCDIILNTVPYKHEVSDYLGLLAYGGKIVMLGLNTEPHTVSQLPLVLSRKTITGTLIGGIKSTQECIDFCAKHQIYPECKTMLADKLDWIFDELTHRNKDGLRYVLDIKKSLEDKKFTPADFTRPS